MTDTTTSPTVATASTEASPLVAKRQALIDRFLAHQRQGAEHRAHGRKASAMSEEAKASNRSHEIRLIEVEMEIEGVEYTPWEKPASSRARVSRVQPWTTKDTERLAALARVYKTTQAETTKASADQQIQALLKRAERLAKQVKDPR